MSRPITGYWQQKLSSVMACIIPLLLLNQEVCLALHNQDEGFIWRTDGQLAHHHWNSAMPYIMLNLSFYL